MNRRSFLSACIATFTAPAIVRATSLMPLSTPYIYTLWADGIHDDAPALNAIEAGLPVRGHDGSGVVKGMRLLIGSTVFMCGGPLRMSDCEMHAMQPLGNAHMIHIIGGVQQIQCLSVNPFGCTPVPITPFS